MACKVNIDTPNSQAWVWLGGKDPVVQSDRHKNQPADYMDLFGSTDGWPVAASRVKVFKISTQMALRTDLAEIEPAHGSQNAMALDSRFI